MRPRAGDSQDVPIQQPARIPRPAFYRTAPVPWGRFRFNSLASHGRDATRKSSKIWSLMLRPIIFVNRRSEFADHNVGDRLCSPFLYFRHFYRGGYRAEILLRIRGLPDRMKYAVLRRIRDTAQAIVIGGGGLIGNRYFREGLQYWTEGPAPKILWGAGHNSHDGPIAVADWILKRPTTSSLSPSPPSVFAIGIAACLGSPVQAACIRCCAKLEEAIMMLSLRCILICVIIASLWI